MKIVFRLNYHTTPGQNLWVKIAITAGDARIEHALPLRWINARQWQTEWEVEPGHRIEYRYLFRQDSNGVELEEWGGPRLIDTTAESLIALDTWCSAGTVDYAYETKAFAAVLDDRSVPKFPQEGNHLFRLKMAAVPKGRGVCLLGNVWELGGWDRSRPVPMMEISPNLWQAKVHMSTQVDVEYKYGLYDLESGELIELEQAENRWFYVPKIAADQLNRISDEAYRRTPQQLFRGAGVAVPVFSLRSKEGLGVGEFADLKPLADWAVKTGLKLIQILPINDTTSSHTWTDSYPYSAISAFALHPIYLRIDAMGFEMPEDFLRRMEESRETLNALSQVSYESVMRAKLGFTREIYDAYRSSIWRSQGFRQFVRANRDWVIPYAAFCLIRDQTGTADFSKWVGWKNFDRKKVDALVHESGEHWPEIAYHLWLQYELDVQLTDAVSHLHERGIALKGDLPIGIDRESVDAWSAPHLYKMEAQTGAPPDAFAVKGQNWGFPTYNWELMKKDGYAWWSSRFERLSRYFDAYRIDHILGFFRIWQIPYEQTDGIMGWFDPALTVHLDEFARRGIWFDYDRFCKPYLRGESLHERFGDEVEFVKERFLEDIGDGLWKLKDEVSTQRKIVEYLPIIEIERFQEALLECVSDVLFFEMPGSGGREFHPRCAMQSTRSFASLSDDAKWRIEELYNDYFYRRQEDFWQAQGYEKLPAMRRASTMLLCGEDLGMVPACVPGVLKETGILTLEIQRMPKAAGAWFFNPHEAPYMSVVSPSTHDMPTLREWWREDPRMTSAFAWEMFGMPSSAEDLSGDVAARIIDQHLRSPAMWAIFPLQDLLAIDEQIRNPDLKAERINVPAIMPYYWRYRMHLGLEELSGAKDFNGRLQGLVTSAGR